jgi:hypothetical protein
MNGLGYFLILRHGCGMSFLFQPRFALMSTERRVWDLQIDVAAKDCHASGIGWLQRKKLKKGICHGIPSRVSGSSSAQRGRAAMARTHTAQRIPCNAGRKTLGKRQLLPHGTGF